MRTKWIGWSVCGATVLAFAAGGASAQEDTWSWSAQMGSGDQLTVRNITGNIHVVRASGGAADVRAQKTGTRQDFDRVAVHVERESDGYTICAVYDPRDDETCESRRNRDHDNIDASVDFEVSLPDGVGLSVTSVTGDVEVAGVRSRVDVKTVSGDVEVSTSETASASTVSGDVDVSMGNGDWDDLSFHSVSGDVTIALPDGIGTEVDFASLSGDLDSDFDITTRGRGHRWIGSHVQGVIGGGGRNLDVNTVSGDLRLRRTGG